jgi:predicted nucleotidyltransferase
MRAELASLGVRSLDLFGSVARGDSGPDSDVDLLVEFAEPIGLFHFFRVQKRLEQVLGRRVDLVMRDAVKRQLRARVFAEAVRAT